VGQRIARTYPGRVLVRRTRSADAASVLAVLVARDVADIGRPDVSMADVVADIERPEADAFVAEAAGAIRGAAVLDGAGAIIAVDPAFEGRGAGTALREAVERRGRERGLPERQAIVAGNETARAHLLAAGYRRDSEHPRLRGPLDGALEADPRVTRFDLDADGVEVEELMAEGIASLGFRAERSYDAWRAHVERALDPAFRLCVRDAEGIAGAVVGERWDDGVGYVEELAVRPRAQGRGYGRALVQTLLVAFRDAGLTTAELSVRSTNAPAIALYASLGLREAFRQERWVRE
jgi:ribosomal protein S18 acetylase RimI-like enzyme